MASLALFIGGIASAWVRELDINCGCFAPSVEKSNYALVIARRVLIAAAGVLLFWRGRRDATGASDGSGSAVPA